MPSNSNKITTYIHCGKCLDTLLTSSDLTQSPKEYQDVSFGWTEIGLQLWCNRCDVNILHVDFEGQTHPANTTRHRE